MLLFFITYNLKQLHGHLINILKVTFKGFVKSLQNKKDKNLILTTQQLVYISFYFCLLLTQTELNIYA